MTKRDFIRYSFVFLTFLGVFSTYPKAVHQARAEEPSGDVIYISTPQEFQDINLDLTAHYEIVNDIDFTGFYFKEIAKFNDFTGIIDGNGFKISNVLIPVELNQPLPSLNPNINYSLIVNNNGLIKDLVLYDVSLMYTHLPLEKFNFSPQYNFSFFVFNNKIDGQIINSSIHIKSHEITFYAPFYSSEKTYSSFNFSFITHSNRGLVDNTNLFFNGPFRFTSQYDNFHGVKFAPIFENFGLIESSNFYFFQGVDNDELLHIYIFNDTFIHIAFIVNLNYGTLSRNKIYSSGVFKVEINDGHLNFLSSTVIFNYGNINQTYFKNHSIYVLYNPFQSYSGGNWSRNILISVSSFAHINFDLANITDCYVIQEAIIDFGVAFLNYGELIFGAIVFENKGLIKNIYIIGSLVINHLPPSIFSDYAINYRSISFEISFLVCRISDSNSSISNIFVDLVIDIYAIIDSDNKASEIYSITNLKTGLEGSYQHPSIVIQNRGETRYFYFFNGEYFYWTSKSTMFNSSIFDSEIINWFLLYFSTINWSFDQNSNLGIPVLKNATLFDFPLSNNNLYPIGTSITVTDKFNVILNGMVLDEGTYFFSYIGTNHIVLVDVYNSIINELNILIVNEDINISNGENYFSSITPNINGFQSLSLNGDSYTIGTPITTPGLHTLTIYGENGYEQEITFTIVLETNGVTDESTYIDSVTPTFSGGTATLNGEPFESGTEITDVGNYTLIISGVNDFIEEINFKILPVITGLQDGVTEDPGFQPNITGEGITLELNDDPYTLGTPITTPGLHTLTIYGENGYEQEITFTIELVFNGISNNQTIIDNEVTLTFSGGIAELNGVVIESGFKTDKLGNYQLLITGVNDEIILNYNFRILPNVLGLNNLVYLGNVNPTISGNYSSMTLNGLPYSGTNITMPGDHELIIYGHSLDENNQFEILFLKNFRVNVDIRNVMDEANYVNQSKNIIISGGNATLNSQSIELNHTATSIGHYTLVITGTNDYRYEINFTISPEINGVNQGQAYISSTNIQVLGSDAQLILNGSPITNGVLTQPGDHELVINGVGGFEVRRSFNIIATITGVTNNAEYLNDSRTITFSGGQATLNGQSIESGYVLDRIGNFELEISGVNDYKLIYTFTNLPNISGVSEGVSYNGFTNIEVLGNGVNLTMNSESFSNGNYSQPGQHELQIIAAGDYLQVINFTIVPIVSGGVIAGQQYVNSTVNMTISGGNPTLNGVPISLVFSVNEVGNYHLVLPQTNLPNFELMFYIIPDISRLQDNRTYNGSVTPTILGEGMDLTLNNKPYVSGTTISNPGQNTIRITSANGEYLKVFNFTITLQFSGLADGVTYYDVVTPSFSGGVVTLNSEPFISNTEITTYGEFELVILGDNDFLRIYEFTILPYNMSFPQDGASRDEVDLKIFRVHSLTAITLNDKEISQTRLIQEVGHYDLVITFDGNVISDTRFTVEPQDYVQDGSEFTSPISIHHPFATVKINGREVNQSYRVDIQRQYTVEVFGVNDYYHTYSFSFINENLESYQQLIAPMIITAIGSLAVFFIRKRWVS